MRGVHAVTHRRMPSRQSGGVYKVFRHGGLSFRGPFPLGQSARVVLSGLFDASKRRTFRFDPFLPDARGHCGVHGAHLDCPPLLPGGPVACRKVNTTARIIRPQCLLSGFLLNANKRTRIASVSLISLATCRCPPALLDKRLRKTA